MKFATIALATALALSSTFVLAQSSNGTAGGATTLSGTGTSKMGGDTAGAVGTTTGTSGSGSGTTMGGNPNPGSSATVPAGGPNNRGGLVGGADDGTRKP
jgi:hypothetical protein